MAQLHSSRIFLWGHGDRAACRAVLVQPGCKVMAEVSGSTAGSVRRPGARRLTTVRQFGVLLAAAICTQVVIVYFTAATGTIMFGSCCPAPKLGPLFRLELVCYAAPKLRNTAARTGVVCQLCGYFMYIKTETSLVCVGPRWDVVGTTLSGTKDSLNVLCVCRCCTVRLLQHQRSSSIDSGHCRAIGAVDIIGNGAGSETRRRPR